MKRKSVDWDNQFMTKIRGQQKTCFMLLYKKSTDHQCKRPETYRKSLLYQGRGSRDKAEPLSLYIREGDKLLVLAHEVHSVLHFWPEFQRTGNNGQVKGKQRGSYTGIETNSFCSRRMIHNVSFKKTGFWSFLQLGWKKQWYRDKLSCQHPTTFWNNIWRGGEERNHHTVSEIHSIFNKEKCFPLSSCSFLKNYPVCPNQEILH